MSNLLGVEETPAFQPAECSWGSGDRAVNKWFLRLMNPDVDTTSLLMGEIFFHHCATAVGYVHRSTVEAERVRLIEVLENALEALDRTSLTVGAARNQLAVLDSLEGPLAAVRELLLTFQEPDDSEFDDSDLEPDADDGEDADTAPEAVVRAVQQATSKDDSGTDKPASTKSTDTGSSGKSGKPAVRKDS
jgi:hypothetical protein